MGEPDGGTGMAVQMTRLETIVSDFAPGIDFVNDVSRQTSALQDRMSAVARAGEYFRTLQGRLSAHARRFGTTNYSDLETYLTYLNTAGGGTWAALQDYRWRAVYNAIKGGSVYPARNNLYFEVLQGATYTNAVGKFVVSGAGAGTFTAGQTISSSYAGGIPKLEVSGLAGSGVVTITGTEYDPATKTATAGKTWLVTVTANGDWYDFTGTHNTNALIVAVSNVTIAAGITAGTLYIEAERPAMRSGTCGADVVTNTTVGLDDSASSVNDYYNGLIICTDADRYTERTISDYDGTTKVATVSVAWGTNPTASVSLFRVKRKLIA